MNLVFATLSVCAFVLSIVALLAALDSREFWRTLLEDFRATRQRSDWSAPQMRTPPRERSSVS